MNVSNVSNVNTTVTNQGNYTPTKEIAKEIAEETTENKFLELDNPVEITISDEAKEQYREMAKQMTKPYQADLDMLNILRNGTILNGSGLEPALNASRKELATAGEGKKLNFQEKAENLLGAYAKLYDEISQGYDNGTKAFYVSDNKANLIKLTKEEALAELDRSYEKVSESMEQQEKQYRWGKKILAQGTKQLAETLESRGRDATKERDFLRDYEQKQQRIKESNDDIEIDGFSKKMIYAANDFKEQYGTKDIVTILSEMGLFERLKLNI